MTAKEIFDKAENGTLTYDQFQELCKTNKVKLVDLGEGNYVDKKKYLDDLSAKDSQIETLNGTITTRDKDLEALKGQLAEAGTDSTKLQQLTNDFSSLQAKYDADMKASNEKLNKQAYEFAVKEFANAKKFTSNAAKRDFINSMINKELKMDNGKILGAEDFVTSYSTDNADAFVVDDKPEPTPEPAKPQPQFAQPTPGVSGADDKNAFHFNFTGVRSHGETSK